ncbi:MAG: hypothetical protein R2822_17720 [Spirosomataceae bacterium]
MKQKIGPFVEHTPNNLPVGLIDIIRPKPSYVAHTTESICRSKLPRLLLKVRKYNRPCFIQTPIDPKRNDTLEHVLLVLLGVGN